MVISGKLTRSNFCFKICFMPKPIIFMKTGVIGCRPEGFNTALTHEYTAESIKPIAIRDNLNHGAHTRNLKLTEQADAIAEERARQALQAGTNVIYDRYLNTKNKRNLFRLNVPESVGAMSVLLWHYAPKEVITARIFARHNVSDPGNPSDKDFHAAQEQLRLVDEMIDRTDPPEIWEGAVFLDGTKPMSVLLDTIAQHISSLETAETK